MRCTVSFFCILMVEHAVRAEFERQSQEKGREGKRDGKTLHKTLDNLKGLHKLISATRCRRGFPSTPPTYHRVRTLKIIILYGQNVPTNFFRKARAPSHNSSVLHSQ